MITSKRQLIDETTSPLHRLMWLYNANDPERRSFENNFCAFHVGNGYFLSAAHGLRAEAKVVKSIDEETYRKELLYKLDGSQKIFMEQHYFFDDYTRKLYLNTDEPRIIQDIATILKQKMFDTRWDTLTKKGICSPYLLVQLRSPLFYNSQELTSSFSPDLILHEPAAGRYDYLVQLELVEAFYSADIALFKAINTPQEIISRIPDIDINCDFLEEHPGNFHCLQASPNHPAGRLVNEARIEGVLDHFSLLPDEVAGRYVADGLRYMVNGYFRFGSSGAPYIMYEPIHGRYAVNAIQSEACPVQLSINDSLAGNFQFVHAIASPLFLIADRLKELGVI